MLYFVGDFNLPQRVVVEELPCCDFERQSQGSIAKSRPVIGSQSHNMAVPQPLLSGVDLSSEFPYYTPYNPCILTPLFLQKLEEEKRTADDLLKDREALAGTDHSDPWVLGAMWYEFIITCSIESTIQALSRTRQDPMTIWRGAIL